MGTGKRANWLWRSAFYFRSILTVKDLVGKVMQFDPTGYGSCAWVVLSFGLQVSTVWPTVWTSGVKLTGSRSVGNDKERNELAFEDCDFLADLMARFSRMQLHYWDRAIEDAKPLEDAMIKVCA
jgi:hypothetical protein